MSCTTRRCALLFALLLLVTQHSFAVHIETVPVGYLGNPADTRYDATGFGSVGYHYRIGKYEVTNAQYAKFLNGVDPTGANTLALYSSAMTSDARGGIILTSGAASGSKYSVKAGRDNNPVVFVSWYDSIRFANWMHNGMGNGDTENGAYTLLGGAPTPSNGNTITRNSGAKWWLPSEDEWYKAAYYNPAAASYFDYPTASNSAPTAEPPPGGDNSANYNSAAVTNVGAYRLSTSPYGTFDQGGNVWEWNETVTRTVGGSIRGLRGGSWNDFSNSLHASNRSVVNPPDQRSFIGFRVASIPEPSTTCLAALGMLALVWWRRRRN